MILTQPQGHDIVYLDPPWYRTPCGTAKTPYETMTWDELKNFELGAWMNRDCVIACWRTGPTEMQESEVLRHWCDRFGLHPGGVGYFWIKTKLDGTPIGASGPRQKFVKQLGEWVTFLTTKKRGRVFPLQTEAQSQWVFAPKARRGEHSKKPQQVRDNLFELFGPERSYVELFARSEDPRFNSWGNEMQ